MNKTQIVDNELNKDSEYSWRQTIAKINSLVSAYSVSLGVNNIFDAFSRAGFTLSNQAQIQNTRIKAISSLPVDYTKEEIGNFLRNPYGNEKSLRQTSEILRWTAYPYFKITKTIQDIPTYKYYFKPSYIDKETAKEKDFIREAILLDKINKKLRPDIQAHKVTGNAAIQGKVFYHLRADIDKIHNKVNYVFMQQLPEDYTQIIGFNNISGYTVSFNLMYFMKAGTDYRQFGDLFTPYMEDFGNMFEEPKEKDRKFVYASTPTIDCKGRKLNFYPTNLKKNAIGNPRLELDFAQNGRWAYYVSLPIDKVWTFEIDNSTPALISPFAGLMLTYAQQSDYEAAQLSLLLNPLIKIFTGEIPYRDDNGATTDDNFKLSQGGKALFEAYFNDLMARNNTGGVGLYLAPAENIKSHDFAESANANEISESFNRYGIEKAGLAGIIPATDDVKASQVDAAMKIESRFASATIYPQFEKMMNSLYDQLNLNYDWEFKMFGSIFTDGDTRENARKDFDKGDLSSLFTLSALDNESWLDKLYMNYTIKGIELLQQFEVPQTAYTQSKSAGRPQTEGNTSDAKEKAVDAGTVKNE